MSVALPIALSACASGSSLNGSMEDLTSLSYTGAAVKLQGNSLVIQYQDFVDGGGNIPFELTYNTAGIPLDAGRTLLLDAGTPAGLPRAIASRTVIADNRTFSAIDRGTLTLSTAVVEDSGRPGSFTWSSAIRTTAAWDRGERSTGTSMRR